MSHQGRVNVSECCVSAIGRIIFVTQNTDICVKKVLYLSLQHFIINNLDRACITYVNS